MAGTFGYELDINKLTQEEKAEIQEQISIFKKHYHLIQYGDYYRISSPLEGTCTVWEDISFPCMKILKKNIPGNGCPLDSLPGK